MGRSGGVIVGGGQGKGHGGGFRKLVGFRDPNAYRLADFFSYIFSGIGVDNSGRIMVKRRIILFDCEMNESGTVLKFCQLRPNPPDRRQIATNQIIPPPVNESRKTAPFQRK